MFVRGEKYERRFRILSLVLFVRIDCLFRRGGRLVGVGKEVCLGKGGGVRTYVFVLVLLTPSCLVSEYACVYICVCVSKAHLAVQILSNNNNNCRCDCVRILFEKIRSIFLVFYQLFLISFFFFLF